MNKDQLIARIIDFENITGFSFGSKDYSLWELKAIFKMCNQYFLEPLNNERKQNFKNALNYLGVDVYHKEFKVTHYEFISK